MLSADREFHYMGELTLKGSHFLNSRSKSIDDKINWLFLKLGERQFSFIYDIEKPSEASYNLPFQARLSFMMIDVVKNLVKPNEIYEVLRGPETIGCVKIIAELG